MARRKLAASLIFVLVHILLVELRLDGAPLEKKLVPLLLKRLLQRTDFHSDAAAPL